MDNKKMIQYAVVTGCAVTAIVQGNKARVAASDLISASKNEGFKLTMDGNGNRLPDILDLVMSVLACGAAIAVGIAVYGNIKSPETYDII